MPSEKLRSHATIAESLRFAGAGIAQIFRRLIHARVAVSLARSTFLVLACGGCQRGCLTAWLIEHGAAGQPPATASPLDGIDCSDGLLRCTEGRVEASELAHLSSPCGRPDLPERGKACVCPWRVLGECRAGCAEDGLEVNVSGDAGLDQLCVSLVPIARPVLPEDHVTVSVCADSAIRCTDGIVRSCEGPGLPERALARCVLGCEPGISLDMAEAPAPGGRASSDGRVTTLCRHVDAERR